jgi:hypothetical protein
MDYVRFEWSNPVPVSSKSPTKLASEVAEWTLPPVIRHISVIKRLTSYRELALVRDNDS